MHNILDLDPLIYCHKSCESGCCQVNSVRRKANTGPGNVHAATPRDRLDPAADGSADSQRLCRRDPCIDSRFWQTAAVPSQASRAGMRLSCQSKQMRRGLVPILAAAPTVCQ